jgi:hypothetical protein
VVISIGKHINTFFCKRDGEGSLWCKSKLLWFVENRELEDKGDGRKQVLPSGGEEDPWFKMWMAEIGLGIKAIYFLQHINVASKCRCQERSWKDMSHAQKTNIPQRCKFTS